MTARSPKPCAGDPLCPALVTPPARYCPQHNRTADHGGATAHQRGYDRQHYRDKARYIRDRAPRNPEGALICENCGRTEADLGTTLHFDHIDGLGPLGPRAHDPDNHQLLCSPCHATKTAAQTGLGR